MNRIKLLAVLLICTKIALVQSASLEVKEEINNIENNELMKCLYGSAVEVASEKLDQNKLIELIKNTKNINQQNNSGLTALHIAVMNKNIDAIRLLIQDPNCNVNLEEYDGYTPLALAVDMQNIEIIELLLSRKDIKVDTRSFKGKKLFFEELKKVKDLPLTTDDNCTKINIAYKLSQLAGITPLMQAIKLKNRQIIVLLFKKNANPCLTTILNPQNALSTNNDNETSVKEFCNFECKELDEEINLYTNGITEFIDTIKEKDIDINYLISYCQNYKINFNAIYSLNCTRAELVRYTGAHEDVLVRYLDASLGQKKCPIFSMFLSRAATNIELSKILPIMIEKGLKIQNLLIIPDVLNSYVRFFHFHHAYEKHILEFTFKLPEITEILLKNGFNPNFIINGKSILDKAIAERSPCLQMLINAGAKHKIITNKFN